MAISERIPLIVNEVIDEVTKLMLKEKEAFDPIRLLDFMVYNIVGYYSFGEK